MPVCIVGVGACTPVGANAPSSAAAVRAGIAAFEEHPFMIDSAGQPMIVARASYLTDDSGGAERLLQLALPAAHEALEPLIERGRASSPVSVLIALPEGRPGMPENLEKVFGQRFHSHLAKEIQIQDMSCYTSGHAGSLLCMEQALSLILSGTSQICLVGGVDSYLVPETLEWLDGLEQLHSESTVWGFCPGEGTGFCLLTSQKFATAIGLSADIELLAAASAKELNPIKTETVCIGQGLSEAFQKSLVYLPRDSHVNHTICDMNGEPYRGNEYGFAILRTGNSFADDADFMTPADCWGDVGAASGTLFAILATFAAKKGYNPGPFTLLWASSEGGLRAAALLQALSVNQRS